MANILTYPSGAASTDTVTNLLGWGNYRDGETSPATQTFNTTPSKLQIDAAGLSTNETYLPNSLSGGASLWDSTNNKITPASIGDSYDIRIDLEVTAKSGSPTNLTFQLDIGGGASPTISVVERDISISKTPPYTISIGFPIFCLSTFLTNGGQLFFSTGTGSVTVAGRGIFISRNYSATS